MVGIGKVARWAALVSGALIALLFALLELGAHVYSLPVLAPYGSLLLNWFAPWFVILPLIAAVSAWLGGPKSRLRLRRGVGLFALAVALVGAVAFARMAAAVQGHGVDVQFARTLTTHRPLSAKADHDLVYSSFEGAPLRLLVYRPENAPQVPAPVLIYVHGGGWVEGDRFAGGENMQWFARQGWLTIAIDYPLSSATRHLWDKTTDQVGCALVWAGANAARFGGDPKRVAMLGDSAGGNLVLNAAYRGNAGRLRSPCGGSVPRVSAVSVVYPAVALAEVYRSDVAEIGDLARTFAHAYVGGPPQRYPERYAHVDPAYQIGPQAPPTLVIVGENDHLLPPGLTYRFAEQARRGGVPVDLIRFPYGQHLFDQATNSLGNQLVLGATHRFLEARVR